MNIGENTIIQKQYFNSYGKNLENSKSNTQFENKQNCKITKICTVKKELTRMIRRSCVVVSFVAATYLATQLLPPILGGCRQPKINLAQTRLLQSMISEHIRSLIEFELKSIQETRFQARTVSRDSSAVELNMTG